MRTSPFLLAGAAIFTTALGALALPSSVPQAGCFDSGTTLSCDTEADTTNSFAASPSETRGHVEYQLAQSAPVGKPARCVWDNGMVDTPEVYACEFRPVDGDGSFSVIRDDGYELMLEIEQRGVGTVQEYGDGRALLNYGRFYRSKSDPACWDSQTGEERLCAY